jgi:hypothetical protein
MRERGNTEKIRGEHAEGGSEETEKIRGEQKEVEKNKED